MERNPRIKIRPTACLHGLTIRPLAPWSVAKTSSPGESYWSSLASLDRPWLFLNAKKFSTRCLFIFVNPMILRLKHGSRKPQDWQQPKRGRESREVQEELIFLLFDVGRQTQKEEGKWASITEKRLTRIFEGTKVFPTLRELRYFSHHSDQSYCWKFTIKTARTCFYRKENRNKRFMSKDGPTRYKTRLQAHLPFFKNELVDTMVVYVFIL